ncbi:MAG: hypothetical protein JXR78_00680 [Victivallales bacterium]|nr:hypothetical protein [Victivallales bacterium]
MGKTEKDISNYRIAYPEELQQHENNYLEEDSPVLGVGLSGGGIRSATFCLGVFQSFAFARGLLGRIKYISSVSGGGYFASFLSAAALKFRKQGLNTTKELGKMLRQDNHRDAVNHLRDRGNYIAPSGMSDYMKIVSVFLRNILVINFVMAVFCMMIFFLAELIELGIIAVCPECISNLYKGCSISLWLFVSPAIFGLFSIPLMLVFWLIRPAKELFSPLGCIIVFIAAVIICRTLPMYSPEARNMISGTMFIPFSVYIASGLGICLGFYLYISKDFSNPVNRRITRDKLEAIQAGVLKFIIVAAMLGILLSTARCIIRNISYAGLIIVGIITIIILISSSAGYLLKKFKGKIKTIELISLVLTVSWMLILAISVELIVSGSGLAAAIGFVVTLAISIIIESDYKFVNLCSLNFFYKSRLEEAYLGAPFPNPSEMPNTKLEEFYGEGTGFIHLYNVTLNETISGKTGVTNRDHNGIALAIGPCGISLGVKHHLSFSNWTVPKNTSPLRTVSPLTGYKVFAELDHTDWNPEPLGAASWAAISGAAASPGMGKQGNCMKSALLTLANVRLGYWWDSGVMHGKQEGLLHKLFGVQKKLLAEFCCNFKGTADRFWYLSDGGHFENLAGYELIRRRLPLIVLIDGEQDGEYNFDGLACLIRKAEMDFGARIEFFTQQELANPVSIAAKVPGKLRKNFKKLGSLSDRFCIPQELGKSGSKHAAMGTVHYRNSRSKEPGSSLIIYLKASLSDDEELDLQCYHKEHPDFPHQSTSDQFFDENQWESYRKLGEHAGKSISSIINKLVETPKRRGRKEL